MPCDSAAVVIIISPPCPFAVKARVLQFTRLGDRNRRGAEHDFVCARACLVVRFGFGRFRFGLCGSLETDLIDTLQSFLLSLDEMK